MRNVKVNKIYNHQKSGESANSEVQQEKNSKRCKKNLKYQSKTVDRLLPISVFFFLPTSVAAKSHLHSGRVLLSPTQAKDRQRRSSVAKTEGVEGGWEKEVKYFNAEKTNILLSRVCFEGSFSFHIKILRVFPIIKYYKSMKAIIEGENVNL